MSNPYDVEGNLSSDTGTASGNPTRVIMRQKLTDNTQSTMEFLKDQFANKPLITQTIGDGSFISYTELDMRNKSYLDNTPIDPATDMTNTLTLIGADVPMDQGNYDSTTDDGDTYVSAGAYTYTDGTNYGGSLGTYSYADSGLGDEFQPTNFDYSLYCDDQQNSNWSGSGACTNGNGSGGGFRSGGGRMWRW